MSTIDEEIAALRADLLDLKLEADVDEEDIEDLVGLNKERGKYLAQAVDRASTALIGLGIFTPALNAYYGSVVNLSMTPVKQLFGVFGCVAVGAILHAMGRNSLVKGYKQ